MLFFPYQISASAANHLMNTRTNDTSVRYFDSAASDTAYHTLGNAQ